MMSRRFMLSGIASASFALGFPGLAAAQSYPERPVKIVVAGVAGTPFDLLARSVADKLSASLKQTFVVELGDLDAGPT